MILQSDAYRNRLSPSHDEAKQKVEQYRLQHPRKGAAKNGSVNVRAYERNEHGQEEHIGAYTRRPPHSVGR